MSFFIKELIIIRATCDKCGEMFKVTVKEKHHPGKAIETYFRCTHCKHKYLVHFTDEWCRQEQKEIKRLNDEMHRRRSKLLNRMDSLASKYEAST